jgi:hypothetical protein
MTQKRFVGLLLVAAVAAVFLLTPAAAHAQVPYYFKVSGHMSVPRDLLSVAPLDDGRVLIAGGRLHIDPFSATDLVEIHDPKTGLTTPVAPLFAPRASSTAIRFSDGRIGLFGGMDANFDDLADVAVYDPDSDTWALFPMPEHMPAARVALLLNGQVLVAGARNAYRFDPLEHRFVSAGTMKGEHFGGAIATLSDGRVMIVGNANPGPAGAAADIYDPSSNVWTATGATVAPGDLGESNLFALEDGGAVHVTSDGWVQTYDASRNAWRLRTTPPHDHHFPIAMLSDGKVFVGNSLTDVYDLTSHSWTDGPTMQAPRSQQPAVAMGDGTYVITGSHSTAAPSTAIEIFRRNQAPVADAGADRTVSTCDTCVHAVIVDGSSSTDPDGQPLTYKWSVFGITLATSTTPATHIVLAPGVWPVTLTVTDPYGAQDSDTVSITVAPVDTGYRDAIADLHRQVGELESRLAAELARAETLTTEVTSLQGQALEAATLMAALRNENAALRQESAALQEQLTMLMQDRIALQGRVDLLLTEKATLQSENAFLANQLAQCVASRDENTSLLDGYEAALRTMFRNATFEIPGATPMEQLQSLLNALEDLKKGQQRAIFKGLGGTPGKKGQ